MPGEWKNSLVVMVFIVSNIGDGRLLFNRNLSGTGRPSTWLTFLTAHLTIKLERNRRFFRALDGLTAKSPGRPATS